MDLVDLDKVLDEFEASEAQQAETSLNGIDDDEIQINDVVNNNSINSNAKLKEDLKQNQLKRNNSDEIYSELVEEKTETHIANGQTSGLCLHFTNDLDDQTFVNGHADDNDELEKTESLNNISDPVSDSIEPESIANENNENAHDFVQENQNTNDVEHEKLNINDVEHEIHPETNSQHEIDVKINEEIDCRSKLHENLSPEQICVGFTNVFDDFEDEEEFNETEFEKYLADVKLTNVIKQLEPENPIDDEIGLELPETSSMVPLSEELADCQFEFEASSVRSIEIESVLPECNESEKAEANCATLEDIELSDAQVVLAVEQDAQVVESHSEIAENFDENCLEAEESDSDVVEITADELSPAASIPPEHRESVQHGIAGRTLVTVRSTDDVGSSYKPTESELQLGKNAPIWIPDNDTLVCMLCEVKFNVIKRRHHCRACGRVLCGECCRLKAKLPYVENKEVRICSSCSERLKKIDVYEKNLQLNQTTIAPTAPVPPDPSSTPPMIVPSGLSASADHDSVAQSPGPPDPVSGSSTVRLTLVAPVGVLKRGSVKKEPKQVVFSDGIKPGGDLSESPASSVSTPSQPPESSLVSYKHPLPAPSTMSPRQRELQTYLPDDDSQVPPVIRNGEMKIIDVETLTTIFGDPNADPVVFAVKKNLTARVKLFDLDCCVRSKVWSFASDGLRNVAQDELLVVVDAKTNEDTGSMPPMDVLRYFNAIYEDILKGKPMSDMSYGVASQLGIKISPFGFMGSKDNAGFLHTRPTYQCLNNLCLPEDPFLIGVLIQKIEVPWAKVLPLRLALRLGAEFKCYPWTLVSDPYRKPVVAEIGHTIMNVLNDFRNFTYSIAHLPGSWITLEEEKTVVNVPAEQYNQVSKILSSSNEHVLSWATSFCYKADSHLVCVQQTDTGTYISQTINKEDRIRKVTGGCFVIFNASLKAGGPVIRSSIVEDGVMIQVRPETMEQIRDKLHRQQNFKIQNEPSASPSNNQPCSVEIRWGPMVQAKLKILSPIDGRSLSDAPRYRLYGKVVEVSSSQGLIRLVALFILPADNGSVPSEPDDLHSIVKRVSVATGAALLPHFSQLNKFNLKTIGVRFSLGSDVVDYAVGANGAPLPDNLVPLMDDCLIPVLHARVGDNRHSLKVELTLRLLAL